MAARERYMKREEYKERIQRKEEIDREYEEEIVARNGNTAQEELTEH